MELHQLRYFMAVAKTGNFTRAAESCHVAQPSLSQQLLKLEHELGEKLFERLRNRAVLTPAGEIFRVRADRILHEVEEAQREVHDARGVVRGQIQIGALPTIAPYLLPSLIQTFASLHPEIQMTVHEETTARLVHLVEHNELDLAITSVPIAGTFLEKEDLFEEELFLAIRADHPLARKKRLSLADVAGEKFILMRDGHCLTTQTVQFCHSSDFHPQVTCRSTQVETLHAMVAAGLGISLVPAMAARSPNTPREKQVTLFRPLASPKPTRTIAVVWRKGRSPSLAAREFLKLLKKSGKPLR